MSLQSKSHRLAVRLVAGTALLFAADRAAWGQDKFAIARFDGAGNLSNNFGVPGGQLLDIQGPNESATSIILETGTYNPVLAGYHTDTMGRRQFAVARFLRANGAPDQNFRDPILGTTGYVVTTFDKHGSSYATSLAEDARDAANRKIVVAGVAWLVNCCIDTHIALARYNNDGSLDNNFGTRGRITFDIPNSSLDFPAAVVVNQRNGSITIAGASDGKLMVARFDEYGSRDLAFGCTGPAACDGYHIWDVPGSSEELAYDLAVDRNKNLIVAGRATMKGGNRFLVARYTSQGVEDPTFNGTGFVTHDFSGSDEYARALVVDSSSGYVAAGQVAPAIGGNRQFALVRYDLNGALQTSVVTDVADSTDEAAYDLVQTTNSELLAVGPAVVNGVVKIALVQYTIAGTPSSQLGCPVAMGTGCGPGWKIASAAQNQVFSRVATDNVGWIVVAGTVR